MNMWRWALLVLVGAACLSVPVMSLAQDADTESTGEVRAQNETDDVKAEAEAEAEAEAASPAVNQDGFIPTEKINADTEISFPVDI